MVVVLQLSVGKYSHPIAGILPIYKNEGVTVRLLSYNEIYIKDCNLVRVSKEE